MSENKTVAFFSKKARELLHAARGADLDALGRLRAARAEDAKLMRAQHVVAVEAGYRSWADLREALGAPARRPSEPQPQANVGAPTALVADAPPPSVRAEVEVAMRFLAGRIDGVLQRDLPISNPSEVARELTHNGLATREGARLVLAWRGYWLLGSAEFLDAIRRIGDVILAHDRPTLTVYHSEINAAAEVREPWAGLAWGLLAGSGAFTGCSFGEHGTAALNPDSAFDPNFWSATLAREPWDFETREERVARERAAANPPVPEFAPLPPGKLAPVLRVALALLPGWEDQTSAAVVRMLADRWPDRFSIGGESASDWTFDYGGEERRRTLENILTDLRRLAREAAGTGDQ